MAGNFSKWGFHEKEEGKLRVVLFISRNKDNQGLPDFVERRVAFVTHKDYSDDRLESKFDAFVSQGVDGEFCRMYMSVNARDENKVRKALIHELIDKDDFSLSSISPLVASIAARKENALEKHWMFDFDSSDESKLHRFVDDVKTTQCGEVSLCKTPHGFAVISERGFDTRELLAKWPDVTLKRDDLLCIYWKTNKRLQN